ncbi:MAG: amino acid transporter [Bacteroidetes bacterium GWF2_43_63]|nr:MAG: amino acid transporter [Bacteroidetes bacterium GWE2_42_42]OFY53252.1 MAG: amino acid transporter [Bacteroidetes bacterium GWF2_43_63]HBG71756.1 amino acid transporter [Bacteroidales bacterium]HCB61579.1 amino acid transporter [Bacteroidales bacterium]HCY22791.1 amino acid transporter [Bacteroidales bacterium]
MSFRELFRRKSVADIVAQHEKDDKPMKRTLGVVDLTALGIAAIIGAGIFGTIGKAAVEGGPSVSLLFVITAIACGFSAMAYAQFASSIPISGSAYTYAYASFGELFAWIIGWDLIMEYAIGNIAVAISWSDYFTGFLTGFGWHLPEFMTVDFLTASRAHETVSALLAKGSELGSIDAPLREGYLAWINAPQIGGVHLIADIPAFCIVALISILVFRGIRESKIASNLMVALKLIILIVVIAVGSFYVNPDNWSPFAPNGFSGMMKGVAGVFFAYIGFDAISTTAEECKNPKRDLPRSMMYALGITTVIYIVIALILTGMVPYEKLGVGDPLAFVFDEVGMSQLSGIIALSALIAMAGVLLVFQVGQPRIWMSMSRDGLLPKRFSKLHPKYKTPAFSTVITGIMVAVPALFTNLTEMTDLTSIGTLFAFVLVTGGVILLDKSDPEIRKGFRIPYMNSRVWVPLLLVPAYIALFMFTSDFSLEAFMGERIPVLIYFGVAIVVMIAATIRQWSFIPVVGLLINLYLMSELGVTNWLRFFVWLAVGLVIYFTFGRKHSKLGKRHGD